MRKSALRGFAIAVLLLAIGSLSGEDTAHSKKAQDFEIEGIALWLCQCPLPKERSPDPRDVSRERLRPRKQGALRRRQTRRLEWGDGWQST
jgi:hypothetical protein